jgi:hypothetical protein
MKRFHSAEVHAVFYATLVAIVSGRHSLFVLRFAEPPRRPPAPPRRPQGAAAIAAGRPARPMPPRRRPPAPRPDGGRGPIAIGLALLAAVLAITDMTLIRGWMADARTAAADERSVRDAEDEVEDVRGQINAMRARSRVGGEDAEPRSQVEVIDKRPVSLKPGAVADQDVPPSSHPQPAVASPLPTPETSRAPEEPAAQAIADAGRQPLRDRVKLTALQARIDRLLRSGIEGEVTLFKPLDETESVLVKLGPEAAFLRMKIVADGAASWRIESSATDAAADSVVASIGRKGNALVLNIGPSPRRELLRYVTLQCLGEPPADDAVSIPLGGPYAANFQLAAVKKRESKTLLPPEEVALFEDRIAGMRLARACAADPTLVPGIEIDGQEPATPQGGGSLFQLPLPVAVGSPFTRGGKLVMHFTRDAAQTADGGDFRCTLAGLMIPGGGVDGEAIVLDTRNRKRLESGLQKRRDQSLATMQRSMSYAESERAMNEAAACKSAYESLQTAALALKDLTADAFADQPVRVVLRRAGEPGKLVVTEPVSSSPSLAPR